MKYLMSLIVGVMLGALLTAVAASQEATPLRYINLPERSDDLPYSNAVLVGETLYLSGALGLDPETGSPPAEIEDEIQIILDGMKRRLEMVGMRMEDLVTVEVFCTDVSLYEEFNAVYRTYFTGGFPARTFIGSGRLLRGGHFEVAGIAVKR